MHLSQYAAKVVMLVRSAGFVEMLSHYLVEKIEASPRIEVVPHCEVAGLDGDTMLRGDHGA